MIRARTESLSADKKRREAEEKEKAACKEAEQAHDEAYALELAKNEIEKLLKVSEAIYILCMCSLVQ